MTRQPAARRRCASAAELLQRDPLDVPRPLVAGIQLQGALRGSDRLAEPAEHVQGNASIGVHVGETGSQHPPPPLVHPQRLVTGSEGARHLTHVAEQLRQVRVHVGVLGPAPDRGFEIRQRPMMLAGGHARDRAQEQRERRLGLQREGVIEHGHGSLGRTEVDEGLRQIEGLLDLEPVRGAVRDHLRLRQRRPAPARAGRPTPDRVPRRQRRATPVRHRPTGDRGHAEPERADRCGLLLDSALRPGPTRSRSLGPARRSRARESRGSRWEKCAWLT